MTVIINIEFGPDVPGSEKNEIIRGVMATMDLRRYRADENLSFLLKKGYEPISDWDRSNIAHAGGARLTLVKG